MNWIICSRVTNTVRFSKGLVYIVTSTTLKKVSNTVVRLLYEEKKKKTPFQMSTSGTQVSAKKPRVFLLISHECSFPLFLEIKKMYYVSWYKQNAFNNIVLKSEREGLTYLCASA